MERLQTDFADVLPEELSELEGLEALEIEAEVSGLYNPSESEAASWNWWLN